jgi:Na+/H+ antiporter NhaA
VESFRLDCLGALSLGLDVKKVVAQALNLNPSNFAVASLDLKNCSSRYVVHQYMSAFTLGVAVELSFEVLYGNMARLSSASRRRG